MRRVLPLLAVCWMFAAAFGASRTAIEEFADYKGIYVDTDWLPDLAAWNTALVAALKQKPDVDAAAKVLAGEYGLPPEQMRFLIGAWIASNVATQSDEGNRLAMVWQVMANAQLIAAVERTGYQALAVDAYTAVATYSGRCRTDDFAALVRDAPDRVAVGWRAARGAGCLDWYQAFAALAPEKAGAALMQALDNFEGEDAVALAAGLSRPDMLARVAARDRDAVQAYLAYRQAMELWKDGQVEAGLAAFERLPPAAQTHLTDCAADAREIVVDGLTVLLPSNYGCAKNERAERFAIWLSGAYVAAGRNADAERVFASITMVDEARKDFACSYDYSPTRGGRCNHIDIDRESGGVILLDRLLHHSGEDPYDVAEMVFGSGISGFSADGYWHDLVCVLFSEPQYRQICDNTRMFRARGARYLAETVAERQASAAALAPLAGLNDFAASRKIIAAQFAAVRAKAEKEGGADGCSTPRDEIVPLPPRFAAMPLPASYKDKPAAPARKIDGLAPLPQGYMPVRIEKSGMRVVALCLSQNYDPNGEVSAGGYWVLLSDDGGKSWKAPLYTGLAQFYPYEAAATSAMQMIDGDVLNIEVAIRELDLTTITYPPVGLQFKRQQRGLYVRIPLADLTADSDGDGLTDIAEAHLLLDPHNADSDGDGLADGADSMPNVARRTSPPSSEQQAFALLLEKLYGRETGAILVPPNAGGDLSGVMAGAAQGRQIEGLDRPIIVGGDKADYAAFSPDRMMLVYDRNDLKMLQRMTPDFHATHLSPIVFNRDRTRGYFTWSMGWTGGTVRLILKNGKWVLQEISNWIT